MGLEAEVADKMWNAITAIEAQRDLVKLKIADFPTAKQSKREKFYEHLNRLAHPYREEKTITVEELREAINSGR